MALSARLMKVIPQWKHDAFFDYCDRWMAKEDAYAAARGKHKRPNGEVKTFDAFTDKMWQSFRATAPAQPYAGNNRNRVGYGKQGSWEQNEKP